MIKLGIVVLLHCIGLLIPRYAMAQSEPKLFTTPELRAELELRRLGYISPEPVVTVSESLIGLEEEAEEIVYSLEGIIIRGAGESIVWLNGRGLRESELPARVELVSIGTKGQLRVSASEEKEFQLLPGQVLNLTTETLYESYQWQDILLQRQQLEQAASRAAGELVESVVVDK